MKVLITGGAGFIGSHLADRLLAEGHEALAFDNYETGRRDNLDPDTEGLTIVEDTIADAETISTATADFSPDVIVHAAASYKDPEAWGEDVSTNALGTANVVRAAQESDVKRIIYFQTALCYGTTPIEQPITLEHPLRPDSSYAISKTAGEQYIAMSGIDFVSFRLANPFGPRTLSGPLPVFYQRLVEGKRCFVSDTRRDFIYVGDLVEVVVRAISGVGEGHYHVSSGADVAIKDLYDAAVSALAFQPEQEVEIRPRGEDDAPSILLDPSRTERDFDWSAATPLEEAVGAAIDWYRQNGVEQAYTHLRASRSR